MITVMFRQGNFEVKVDLLCSSGISHSAVQGTLHTIILFRALIVKMIEQAPFERTRTHTCTH